MIEKLDHVNLRTTRLEEMIQWYQKVLGLTAGPRPDFPFKGAWLYVGDQSVVHLVEIENPEATGSERALKLEHFAFTATSLEAFEIRLNAREERYHRSVIPGTNTLAYNIWDPDGNHIHVDFSVG